VLKKGRRISILTFYFLDQASLNENIDIARATMKTNVQKLETLEGTSNMKGFNLTSVNANELYKK
jgi:hypothetical protein